MKIIIRHLVAVFLILSFSSVNIYADMMDIKLKEFIHLISNNFDKTVLIDKDLDYEMTLINTKNITKITYFSMIQDILENNNLIIISKRGYYYIKKKDTFVELINIADLSKETLNNLSFVYDVKISKYKDNNYIATYTNKDKFFLFTKICKKLNYASTLKITGEIYKLDDNKLKENDIDVSFVIDTINRREKGSSVNIDMSQEGMIGFGADGKIFNLNGFIKFLEVNKYLSVITRPNFLTLSGKKSIFKSGYSYRREDTKTDSLNTTTPIATTTYSDDDIGLSVSLTPVLYSTGQVKMNLEFFDTSLSSLDSNNNVIKSNFEYSSNFFMNINTQVILAGVNVVSTENFTYEVPFLSSIPFFGYLFKNDYSETKTSSIILKLKVEKID